MSSVAIAKRFIAFQTGARHNYLIPAILEKNGLLEWFYTDVCADVGLGAELDRICPQAFRVGALKRLLNRRLPSSLKDKTRTFDWVALRYLLRQKIFGIDPVQQYRALSLFHAEFSRAMINSGVGKATHIICPQTEGFEFTEFAKRQGLTIATDIYISPLTNGVIQQEREKYPGLEPDLPLEIIWEDDVTFRRICEVTDLFIAPSQFVLDGLEKFGVSLNRCRLVPYAVGDSWFELNSNPIEKRILFVGTAELRKGIHILGMAAAKLNHRNYEFRVAGAVSNEIRNHELTRNLKFLGRVPRVEVGQEFSQADIFVLPSLAEGSAVVTYEALAVGLPIITTEAAGSVIQDGVEGFIIPEGDVNALAERIEELIENRELRDRMSLAAKERAKNYTWERYCEKLLSALM